MRVAICPTNQWTSEDFALWVDHNERREIRTAAAYDAPVDRAVIRHSVVSAILEHAMPAGNC